MNNAQATALPPGPPTPWWGLPTLRRMSRDYLGFLTEMQRQYGDVCHMKLGPERVYDVFDPALVRAALVDQADHLIRWERGIAIFAQAFGQSVLVTEGAVWRRQRQMLMPGFAPRRVHGYCALMVAAAEDALDKAIPPDQAAADVDTAALMNRLTMDVILRTLFSQSSSDEAAAVSKATAIAGQNALREMFLPMTLPDWLPLPGKRQKRWALGTLHGLVARHIAQREALPPEAAPQDDLLAMLLSVRDAETGQKLTAAERHDQCMVMFQAGHETSATALLWWAWLMARHPAAQAQARAAVDRALAGRPATADDLPALESLSAGLKEAMRLYPPIGALMSRRVIKPLQLGRWTLPTGAMLRISPWLLHRDARWFPDPLAFKPERFAADAESPARGAWIPFGTGPRVCIGQHFAMLEMTLVAASFLQRFEWDPVPGDAEPTPAFNVTLRPHSPLRLRLRRRAAGLGHNLGSRPVAAPTASPS